MSPSKKAVAKVPTKKEAVKEKTVKPVKAPKSSVKLVEFGVIATIPTQQYGNITPSIRVQADSIEEARAVVMPFIEELYATYAEKPRDGSKVAFLGKITETVKEVAPVAPKPAPTAPVAPQGTTDAWNKPAPGQDTPAPVATAQSAPVAQKPEPVLKAEKAIELAMTDAAAEKIREQIVKSTKIADGDKPALLELVDAKIIDFNSNW